MHNTTLPDRALLRVSGDDPRGFLQGLVTNDVAGSLPVYAGLLTPQGKALFDFIIWADGDDLLIDCEAAQADTLRRRLVLYRLRRALSIDRDPDLAVHWALDGGLGMPDPRNPALGRRWIAPANGAANGYHAHRLRVGVVEGAAELGSDATLWLEANAVAQNGVSFTKGCYVGQENTARMFHRDKVRKRLAVIAADAPPTNARAWYPELGHAVVVDRVVEQVAEQVAEGAA